MMDNISVNDTNRSVDKSRRKLLVTIGRSVLFVFTAGVTGFLFQRRRCWDSEGVNYTQLPCQSCRQLSGCNRPAAEVYRDNRSNDQADS